MRSRASTSRASSPGETADGSTPAPTRLFAITFAAATPSAVVIGLRAIAGLRATGLTFAPEAGTQRLRDVIAKNVSEADLEETAKRAFGQAMIGCSVST